MSQQSELEKIERFATQYADAVDLVTQRVQALEAELADVNRQHLRGIKAAVRTVKTIESTLRSTIEANPGLFVKPRTQVLSGIRVGYSKAKGKLLINDDDKVIERIHKHLPDMEDALIKKTETVVKKALGNLTADQLKKLGVKIEDDDDKVVITITDSNVDKLVKALLKEKHEETEA